MWRFAGLPEDFYRDWFRVAAEESLHFTLLREHLATLAHDYGDFDAHDGLWTMTRAPRTTSSRAWRWCRARLEARGLDATPPLQAKLAKAGDARAVAILDVILRDEIGHVAIGNRWYRFVCERAGLDALAIYPGSVRALCRAQAAPALQRRRARAAGFSEEEIAT